MTKYSFLVYHKEYKEFLEDLQELGVLHIKEKTQEFDDQTQQALEQIKKINNTLKFLSRRTEEEKPAKKKADALEIIDDIKKKQEELDKIEQEQLSLKKDIEKARPWGDFTDDIKKKLNDLGLTPRFFTCRENKFNEVWSKDYYLEIINHQYGHYFFVILQETDQEIEIDAEEVKLPSMALSDLEKKYKTNEQHKEEIKETFDQYAEKYQEALRKKRHELQVNTEFNKALINTEDHAESKIKLLEGWVPETKEQNLVEYLEDKDILYQTSKPAPKENVPILLKNGKYSKLFEPIGDLFSLPDYREIDLTPFFAPFFMFFFGFCVGDSGYGLLMLIGTLILRSKVKPSLKPIMTMASFLGGATIIMGLISGTFFGVNLIELETLPFNNDMFLKPIEMFYLSIGLGVLQIVFGMFLKMANKMKQFGFKHGLSLMGWILLIFTAIIFMGGEEMGWFQVEGMIKILQNIFLIISLGLILIFNDPSKSVFASVGLGLYDIYNMVTGVFGDILSYIRLFALGISSAILGLVFNQIAIQFLAIDYVGWLFFIILLLIGHGLNIFLASLGAFVHPLRLTFVEFYKNAGFTGGGKKYKPFSK